jgi:hypothetical protein
MVCCNFNDDDCKKKYNVYMGVKEKKAWKKSALHAAGSEKHKAIYRWFQKLGIT